MSSNATSVCNPESGVSRSLVLFILESSAARERALEAILTDGNRHASFQRSMAAARRRALEDAAVAVAALPDLSFEKSPPEAQDPCPGHPELFDTFGSAGKQPENGRLTSPTPSADRHDPVTADGEPCSPLWPKGHRGVGEGDSGLPFAEA